ncbi:acyl-CoA dehydrogenase family protein [Kitasatospora cinereorecta]|uniref:Acyl-CoA dehydrogenase family protein n=1 Tax=Kitasatospora cinereorecta TaxID=285560 RepID=A0ABW0VBG0_9ACTN
MTRTVPSPDARAAIADALARLPRVVDLLAARAEEHDRDGTFPYQGIEAVHEAGLLTLTVGPRHGGPGATLADTVQVLARLGRGDASVALLTAPTLLLHAEQARTGAWPAGLYRRLLTESRRGPALVDTLRADPPAVTAHRDGEGWLLSGRQADCPGAEALAWMAVRARTDEPQPRVGLFLVRGDSAGVEIDPGSELIGLRACALHDVVLDRVRVNPEAAVRLAPPSGPDRTAESWRELALAAVLLGVGRAAQDWLVRRLGRGAPAGAPCHRAALGELECSLIGAEELVHGLAARVDRGDPAALERTGAAGLLVNRTVTAVAREAVVLAGQDGLSRRHPLERHLRDALSGRAHFTAEDRVLDAVGRSLLG